MLQAVHAQLQAGRLRDLFASSPLVLVYQTLGNVRSGDVASGLQREVEQQVPGSGVRAVCMKLKNTIASATGEHTVARFLQTNNLLLGWQLPQHSSLASLHASRSTPLNSLLAEQQGGKTPPTAAAQPAPPPLSATRTAQGTSGISQEQQHAARPSLPHATIKALISLSLRASERQPVALLSSFYRGEQVRCSHKRGRHAHSHTLSSCSSM